MSEHGYLSIISAGQQLKRLDDRRRGELQWCQSVSCRLCSGTHIHTWLWCVQRFKLMGTCYSSSLWDVSESVSHLCILYFVLNCVGRYLRWQSRLLWPLSSCLMVRWCRSKGSFRHLRPLSYSLHKSRLPRWGHTPVLVWIGTLWSTVEFFRINNECMTEY